MSGPWCTSGTHAEKAAAIALRVRPSLDSIWPRTASGAVMLLGWSVVALLVLVSGGAGVAVKVCGPWLSERFLLVRSVRGALVGE